MRGWLASRALLRGWLLLAENNSPSCKRPSQPGEQLWAVFSNLQGQRSLLAGENLQPPLHCPGAARPEPGAARHQPSSSPVSGWTEEPQGSGSPAAGCPGPLKRSCAGVLPACVWTCRAASRFGALASAFLTGADSAAVAGCARAPRHRLPAHRAAPGRAQLSPHRRSKDHCCLIARGPRSHSPSRCDVCSPQHREPLSTTARCQQALASRLPSWHSTNRPREGCAAACARPRQPREPL